MVEDTVVAIFGSDWDYRANGKLHVMEFNTGLLIGGESDQRPHL